jgi:hypothetical protein
VSAAELLRLAAADGVDVCRSPKTDGLRLVGEKIDVDRWREKLRDRQEEIVALLYEREERAAIYEYDAKFSREVAEKKAGIR